MTTRATTNTNLAKFTTSHNWEALNVSKNTLQELKYFTNHVLISKRGLALFCGPLGTSKKLAASLLAKQVGLPVFRVDLSSLISKYIGETEKNLARILKENSKVSSIIFFDEADALFSKRIDVRDGHDKYANFDIAYLLQRIEDFNGVVILSCNSKSNIDEAFLRKFTLVSEINELKGQTP